MHMAQLRQDYAEFAKRGTVILVVGPEDAQAFSRFWQEHDLPFIGLPNPDHSILKLFGQEVNLFKLGRMPAQVFIDRQGMARYVHYGKSMSDIPNNQEIFELIDGLEHQA